MNKLTFYALKTVAFLILVAGIIFGLSLLGFMIHMKNDDGVLDVSYDVCKERIVVIDAGHGGEDGGACANGVVEKDINLAVSTMLKCFFDVSGFGAVMTRSDDRLLYKSGEENNKKRFDLLNRVAFADEYDDAVFISIHQNKFEIPKYKGLQVYYSANNPNSSVIARLIQDNTVKYIDNSNKREVKEADYRIRVLDMLEKPAVLVECGFLSNPDEALLLTDAQYQKKLAFVMYLSLIEYLNNTEI